MAPKPAAGNIVAQVVRCAAREDVVILDTAVAEQITAIRPIRTVAEIIRVRLCLCAPSFSFRPHFHVRFSDLESFLHFTVCRQRS